MNKNTTRLFKIAIFAVNFTISLLVTYSLSEKFPEINTIDLNHSIIVTDPIGYNISEAGNIEVNDVGQSKAHHFCSKRFDRSIILTNHFAFDPKYIKEGDVILIKSYIEKRIDLDIEYYGGYTIDKLKKLEFGEQKFDSIYYYPGLELNLKILSCYNKHFIDEQLQKQKGIAYIVEWKEPERPTFINSKWLIFLIFCTTFVLLGEFTRIIIWSFKK